jgi:PAS domain S-box-containing protein
MLKTLRVLMVQGGENDSWQIAEEMERTGCSIVYETVSTPETLEAALTTKDWDLVISAYAMPRLSGLEALQLCRGRRVDIPFIIVSDAIGEENAVAMLKAGAHDYVLKSRLERLASTVNRELRAAQQRRVRTHMAAAAVYLASIVEHCDESIVGTTLDGTVISWNAAAERLYGYSSEEILGRSLSVLVPPYRPQELPEFLEKIKRGEPVGWLDTIRIRKDGWPVEVSLAFSPIKDGEGRIIGVSEAARDITRLKQEENERLRLIQDLTTALAQTGGVGVA